jgi:hypothetical protein
MEINEENKNFGIVCNGNQRKFLYRKIDAGLLISFIAGGFVGLAILLFAIGRDFLGYVFLGISLISFFGGRYVGLRILFLNEEGRIEENEDNE